MLETNQVCIIRFAPFNFFLVCLALRSTATFVFYSFLYLIKKKLKKKNCEISWWNYAMWWICVCINIIIATDEAELDTHARPSHIYSSYLKTIKRQPEKQRRDQTVTIQNQTKAYFSDLSRASRQVVEKRAYNMRKKKHFYPTNWRNKMYTNFK